VSCFDIDVTLPPPLPLKLVAAVVLVDPDGRVLIASRPPGKAYAGDWEFPGGKIENGETPETTLARELREELGILTKPSCFSPFNFISYPYPDLGLHMLMMVYVCRVWQGLVQPQEGQQVAWVKPQDFHNYKFVPADVPLLSEIRERI
jgi:8-oxo-dGTP diphosphatase